MSREIEDKIAIAVCWSFVFREQRIARTLKIHAIVERLRRSDKLDGLIVRPAQARTKPLFERITRGHQLLQVRPEEKLQPGGRVGDAPAVVIGRSKISNHRFQGLVMPDDGHVGERNIPSRVIKVKMSVDHKDYVAAYPELIGPALGFTVEAATQCVRLVLSGVFDVYPRLKIIVGHLGEGIPFLLWRIDQALSRSNSGTPFKETFRKNFYLTTSGNFSDTALAASIAEMGVDHIMFSVDWPFISNKMGSDWLNAAPLDTADKSKIFGQNAVALLKL